MSRRVFCDGSTKDYPITLCAIITAVRLENEQNRVEGKEDARQFTYVAIEGPVCAGKTTLIHSLQPLGFTQIPEYVDFAFDNSFRLPKFPPLSEEEARTSFHFYLELETKRKPRIPLKGVVLLDRSVFTLLAFEAGARKLTNIDIFDWAIDQISLRQNELMIPDQVLYIDVPVEESRRRAAAAGMGTPDFLFSPEFSSGFKDAFKEFSSKHPGRFTFVNGCQSQEELIKEVLLLISTK